MTTDDKVSLLSAIIVLLQVVIGIWIYRRVFRDAPEAEDEETEQEETPDFAFLSVREQVKTVKETSDALADLEDLQLQIEESNEDSLLPVRLSWMSRDGEMHELEIFVDGIGLSTECLHMLTETEIHDTRKALSHQCQVLAQTARSRKKGRKYDAWRGGEDIDKVLREVRGSHPD